MEEAEPIIKEAVYQIAYDLPAEKQSTIDLLSKKERDLKKINKDLTDEEKKILREENLKRTLRVNAQKKVESVGAYFNNSVYLVPKEYLEKAEKVVSEIRQEYQQQLGIDVSNKIHVVKFHQDSADRAKIMAQQAIMKRLETLLGGLDKVEKAIVDRKNKQLRPAERRILTEKIGLLKDLADKFRIKDDVKNLLDVVDAKLKDLEELESEEK